MKRFFLSLLMISVSVIAMAQSASMLSMARAELDKRGLTEAEVRARLLQDGINPEAIPPTEYPKYQGRVMAILDELQAQKASAGAAVAAPAGGDTVVATTDSGATVAVPVAAADAPQTTMGEAAAESALEQTLSQSNVSPTEGNNIYGHSMFTGKTLDVFRTTDGAQAPDTYILGEGDEVHISIFGSSQTEIHQRIAADGSIQPAGSSKIFLKGLTLAQGRAAIRSKLSQHYSFRPDQIAVTISTARTLSVSIYGEVGVQGGFTISALNNVFNALAAAGGPTANGSVRNIQLSRAGKNYSLDLYKYMTNPTVGLPYDLQNNDVLFVPLAQKIVGRACGVKGVRPGTYCEPKMTTVGSQDTTGPMTRDELKDLACLNFSADLVMQSFCHTAAYPKLVDVQTHNTLPKFIMERGGVALRPGDGVIHSWLNRMVLPDTVGTGGDSHTRFPMGISFPAGSGLVAFAAATGVMPLDMPESVLVKFTGTMQPGITLRDLVHAIPYRAIQEGLLTVEKKGKKNIFSGRILEIQGLPNLKVEQAFELADASAERSAAGCTIQLNKEPVIEYLNSNIALLSWMIREGYGDAATLQKRIDAMKDWLKAPELLTADPDAEYAAVIEIDMNKITEPILCAPNDPDDARLLSEVQGTGIDEVFIGSCMTNIGHFRAAGKLLEPLKKQLPTKLWLAPPTKMDRAQLTKEGYFNIFGRTGARIEISGCSLCMGNQARVNDCATVVSTSTRNFPNRLGQGANVYLASAELAAVTAILGKLPTPAEYQENIAKLSDKADEIYRYMNFNQMDEYK